MAAIVWTEEALRWLSDIHEYIVADNPEAAGRTVRGIYERVQQLAEHPELGYRYRGSTRGVRILVHGHYRIAYLVRDAQDVHVLGVFPWRLGHNEVPTLVVVALMLTMSEVVCRVPMQPAQV